MRAARISSAEGPFRMEVHHGRVVRCFAARPANLGELLSLAVARAPDAEAVVDGARRTTYRELDRSVRAVASGLLQMGLEPGDRVALLLGNRLEYQILFLACGVAGLILVPMNLRQTAEETAFTLNASGARVLFHETGARLPDPAAVACVSHYVPVTDDTALPSGPAREFAPVDEDAPAVILFTSGTTGRPKGAVLTHCNIVHSVMGFQHHYDLREAERAVLAVPASHVTGLIALLAVSVHVAGCLVIMREFKAAEFLRVAVAERMTYTLIVPAMIVLVLMQPGFDGDALSLWRVCGFGGAPMPHATIDELTAKLPGLRLHNTYGATETTSAAVVMPADQAALRTRQVGRPVSCCDLLVMDDRGSEVPAGEIGEIWMAGALVTPYYWDNPQATAEAFCHGYWKSGDIGSRDADGFVSIHDRKKDMINRGGFKIHSVEVENMLCAHPAVVEAAVVAKPCPVLGERVVAFVFLSDPIDAEALRAFVGEHLSDYKVPEEIHVESSPLPRNANGKLLKRNLRDRIVRAA